MKSWMVRLLMLLTAAMLLAVSGPAAMADDFDGLFGNDIRNDNFGNDSFLGDNLRNNDCGIFGNDRNCDNNFHNNDCGIFGDGCDNNFDDGANLRTIDVGDEECLVEEEDGDFDVLFCDEDQNDALAWLQAFFAQNDAEFNAAS